jgi:hypothetical protein
MRELTDYILGTIVCSAAFVLFYRTVLHRHVSFRTARIYLLASLALAAVIPAFDIPLWKVAPIEVPLVQTFTASAASMPVATPVDWTPVLLWTLYCLGIAVLVVAMIRQVARLA